MCSVGEDALPHAGEVTIRWREARVARGSLRLAQRVRARVPIGRLCELMSGVAREAYADEFEIEWPDGSRTYLHRQVLAKWATEARHDLPPISGPAWAADLADAAERARAIDGVRMALGRLHACGVVDGSSVDDLIRRVHVAAQSLPPSSAGSWRP